jgi:hypothetical protein
MELNAEELDNLVYEVIRDCRGLNPPLGRDEIFEHVSEYLKKHIAKYVLPSLQRLADKEMIIEERDVSRGHPYRYWIPKD